MGGTIVITEKSSQADQVRRAVGSRFGRIYAASGHILELQEPEDVNPDWKRWSFDLLRPPKGVYGNKPVRGQGAKVAAIKKACKSADHVIIATDPDREGHLIGFEILAFIGYRGKASRAIFASVDKVTISKAFDDLRPIKEFQNSYEAGMARQQSDQIFNLTLTRCVSEAYCPGRGDYVGVGRVRTPTLAIVVRRDLEIENFKERDFFVIEAKAAQGESRFVMIHEPKEQIFDRVCADKIAAAAAGFTGPLAVKVEKKKQGPPKLFDLPTLQRAASKWGWSAAKTLDVTQRLYGTHQLLTYPRSEICYLPESQTADVPTLMRGLLALAPFSHIKISKPQSRKGKTGHFCDVCLKGASHTAIVPNVNAIESAAQKLDGLNADERRLFELVSKRYLAALMPDYEYESVTATAQVTVEGQSVEFRAKGSRPLAVGWKEVFGFDEDDENKELPPLKDGADVRFESVGVSVRKIKPPLRYNDGSLIQAMQESWRFIPESNDPKQKALRERLKEAKGIGTPATRAQVIDGLIYQGMLQKSGKHLISTVRGRALIERLEGIAPMLSQPAMTAVWEMRLDEVELGNRPYLDVIDGIANEAGGLVKILKALAESGQAKPLPKVEGGGSEGSCGRRGVGARGKKGGGGFRKGGVRAGNSKSKTAKRRRM